MIEPSALSDYCDSLLDAGAFTDYAPNGLQVEGERQVRRLVTGVTACAALIAAARDTGADAILVHHGWFWKGENPCLVGPKGRRARALVASGASLVAYHLPLDAHPLYGNNAALAGRLRLLDAEPSTIGQGLVWIGRLEQPLAPNAWALWVSERLGRTATLVDPGLPAVERVAWCTGGGQGYIEAAAGLGVDAFLSGEISEQTTHWARELGLCYLAAGHHATERYGVQALGAHLSERFGLEHQFIDVDNPA
ncbi:MAG: Nif3-like dinuclear metal center hexameric protein [Chromatiaceae bacterium]